MKKYELIYFKSAREIAKKFHPKIRSLIKSTLEGLSTNPYQGKELQEELSGYRSLVVKRYRIIYQIEKENKKIKIYYMGPRRTVYEDFRNFLEQILSGEES